MRANEGEFNQIEVGENVCERQSDTLKDRVINGIYIKSYQDICKAIEADVNYRSGYSEVFLKCFENYDEACIKIAENLVNLVCNPHTSVPKFIFPAILIEKYSHPSYIGIPYLVHYTSYRSYTNSISHTIDYQYSVHTVLAMVYGNCSVKIFSLYDLELENPFEDKSIFQFLGQPCVHNDDIGMSI